MDHPHNTRRKFSKIRAFLIAATFLSPVLQAAPAIPTGGQVVAGAGRAEVSGSTLTVTQTSAKLAMNWDSFSIGEGAAVRFVQPSASSVALNRVTGADASVIQGSLTSNGQVFLLNPSGVLFSKTAQVNVGGLVATTLSLSNEDFLAGNYSFSAPGAGVVVNEGNIVATEGGSVALIAARVVNDGSISAERGSVSLAAGSRVTLNLGGLVNLTIDEGVLDGLVSNGGAIRADGGRVLLTARGASELAPAAINNDGIVEARTLATGEQGEIRLLGGLGNGDSVAVSGRLDVSAPNGGNGGFIETSAARVVIADSAVLTAAAPAGQSGSWLLDPNYLDIVATDASAATPAIANAVVGGSSSITTASLTSALNSFGTVTLQAEQQINFTTDFAHVGTRNASLNLLSPVIALGGDITATGAKLNLSFGGGSYAGNVFLYNPVSSTVITRSVITNGGDVYFGGDVGGAHDFLVDAGAGEVRHAASVTGTFNAWQPVYADLVFEYQAGQNNVRTTIDFSIAGDVQKISIGGNQPHQIRQIGTLAVILADFNTYINVPAGTVIDLNTSNSSVTVTRPDLTTTTLTTAANGKVTFTQSERVLKLEYSQDNSSWTQFIANGISYMAQKVSGKPRDYVVKAGKVIIDAGKTINVDRDIRVVAGQFVNNAGATALQPGEGGTWQVWSSNPTPFSADPTKADKRDGLDYDFKQYGATYGVTTPLGTGNGMFYTYQPDLAVKLIDTVTKVYNGNTNCVNLTDANYQLDATTVVDGDNVQLTAGLPTTGTYASKNVGTGIGITSAVIPVTNLSAVSSTNKPVYGYGPSSLTAKGDIGIITKKALTAITGITANDRVYNADTNATLNTGSAAFGGLVLNDVLNISSATGTFVNKNVGTAKTVNVTEIVLGGADAGNYSLPETVTTTASITKAPLTLTGVTAENKVYDGNTSATLGTASSTLGGVLGEDDLSLTSATGTFDNKNVGTEKTVTVTGVVFGGLDAGNYELTGTVTTVADITKKTLTSITGITAQNRVYDTTTDATLNTGSPTFGGLVLNDALTITSATGAFEDKHVGTGKTVSITGIVLGGADAGNYALPETVTTTANITKAPLSITGISAENKVYDTTTAATLDVSAPNLVGLLGLDDLTISSATGNFVNKNVGVSKTVNITEIVFGGADAGNYELTGAVTATANITKAPLGITGVTAENKVYDGNTSATLGIDTPNLVGLLGEDELSISSATGNFVDKNAGTGKTVNVTEIVFGGADAGNYELTGTVTAIADITKKQLTSITGITAQNKTYDGSTGATLNTGSPTFGGLVVNDVLTISSANGAFDNKNVGTGKTVNITGIVLDGADAGNYELPETVTTTADITKALLTVRALDDTRPYSGIGYVGGNGIDITGFVPEEGPGEITGTLVYGGNSQGSILAGTYAITPSGFSAQNYDFSFVSGLLTIEAQLVDAHDFLPKVTVVPVYPVATLVVQAPVSVGGLNYVPVPPTDPRVTGGNGAGSGNGSGSTRSAASGSGNGGNGGEGSSEGNTATDRIDRGASRAIQGPTDVLVISGGLNLGIKPLIAE